MFYSSQCIFNDYTHTTHILLGIRLYCLLSLHAKCFCVGARISTVLTEPWKVPFPKVGTLCLATILCALPGNTMTQPVQIDFFFCLRSGDSGDETNCRFSSVSSPLRHERTPQNWQFSLERGGRFVQIFAPTQRKHINSSIWLSGQTDNSISLAGFEVVYSSPVCAINLNLVVCGIFLEQIVHTKAEKMFSIKWAYCEEVLMRQISILWHH